MGLDFFLISLTIFKKNTIIEMLVIIKFKES